MEYFMDKMQPYELNDILENLQFVDRNGWEQTRIIAYFIAQKMCKKKLEIKDILNLPYDKKAEHNIDSDLINKQAELLEQLLNRK